MKKYTFEEIKDILLKNMSSGWKAELKIFLNGQEYMIIIYENYCSFQRCGVKNGSGEYRFETLDELYKSQLIDNVILERDWNKIEELVFW